MTNEDIHRLIERFLDADTTLEEERMLYAFFQQGDIPEDLEVYREMFAGYADMVQLKDENDAILKVVDETDLVGQPMVVELKPKPRLGSWIKPLGIAASVALLFAVGKVILDMNHKDEMFITYENAHTVTDESVVMANMESTMSGLFADYEENDVELQMKEMLK